MQSIMIKRFLWQQLLKEGSKEMHSLTFLNQKRCLNHPGPLFTGSRSSSSRNPSSGGLGGYWRSLKWVPIPFSVGFAYICYQQYGHIKKRENRHIRGSQSIEDSLAKEWQVNLYRILPFRSLSRLWGRVNSLEVPLFLRAPMYSLYVRLFNCNLSEALVEDLKQYRNLQDFFMRELKPDVRPVDAHHMLVSPCDGRVLHFGKVEKSKLEQVKGITYSLKDFLGPNSTNSDTVGNEYEVSDEDYHSSLCQKEGTSLYHCVIYLAPGDYHRFHSPTDWTAHHRRHFPGELLSVNPGIARWVRGLFNFNERVCITGDWQHGFFSFTAVGATNVGSISFYCDEELCTNLTGKCKPGAYYDKSLKSCRKERGDHDDGVAMTKGTGIGSFNLGSTIVLVFEAPKDFNFVFNSGDKIRLGERLGSL
ncbi:phosphatidylserine decarboxylase proenzyme, mitochondrial isoform X2 [Strongylocentrotus purpuratus]|uniref:Phosphatidylserine decarboxylase proenzyme, mitochondrial n=1 Tax=Strongylocentrotus purpuratus TaxID=7668 RepID=A0A7M7T1N0_STRPU|nr:phosphatidylserine decarboxylase proenzyme, mitochondrial isoform X2 [Strongylocentrotus purpuratus]